MKIKGFITHKPAEKYIDCQDYFLINKDNRRLAIADGMTQSIFSAEWAQLLTEWAIKGKQKSLTSIQDKWQNFVKDELKRAKKEGEPTWVLENAIAGRNGAGSTLCVFQVDKAYNSYSGTVLGDSCLFEIDADYKIRKMYKSGKEEIFDYHPSYYDAYRGIIGDVKSFKNELDSQRFIIAATDAISEFLCLKKKEGEEIPFVKKLVGVSDHDEFCKLVDDWRNEGMHEDDSTAVVIEIDENSEWEIVSMDSLEELIKQEKEGGKDQPASAPMRPFTQQCPKKLEKEMQAEDKHQENNSFSSNCEEVKVIDKESEETGQTIPSSDEIISITEFGKGIVNLTRLFMHARKDKDKECSKKLECILRELEDLYRFTKSSENA